MTSSPVTFPIEWLPEYSLDLREIDAQHRYLVTLINEMWEAQKTKAPTSRFGEILGELESYARLHFLEEEELMRDFDSPLLAEHMTAHREFEARIGEELQSLKSGAHTSPEFLDFLKTWLIGHVLSADRKYASEVNLKAPISGLL